VSGAPRLTDSCFEAALYRVRPDVGVEHVGELADADGVRFLCPCGGGHLTLIPFDNPRNGSAPPRGGWHVSGTGLVDLTLTPSIRTSGGPDHAECWHGFITAGEVVTLGGGA
jgi:hypothetical protein